MTGRRRLLVGLSAAVPAALSAALSATFASAANAGLPGPIEPDRVPRSLAREMYRVALAQARQHIRGGPGDPAYPKPFVDAAFSSNIFYWDTCFIAAYGKYHPDVLPIANALDNFYDRIEPDGHIGREYTAQGTPMWPADHPVSVNPPLLAFAELELQSQRPDLARLRRVYPLLKRHFAHRVAHFRGDDGLFFGDAFGSGMDNIPRHPEGWADDGQGLPLVQLHPELFDYTGLSPRWNRQGRLVDLSAQMALMAEQLAQIARRTGAERDIPAFRRFHGEMARLINTHCWHAGMGFYADLAHGAPIARRHIGMFWVLMAGLAPPARARALIAQLVDPRRFGRAMPVASVPADQPGFSPRGDYWQGGVWAPTNYMVLRGLRRYGQHTLARRLARRMHAGVAEVFQRTGTFWENYAPDRDAAGRLQPGDPARPDFCGWTALVPISVAREFIDPALRPG